ncbi:hypothetical protein JNUCC0626_08575 [Lentzea sp. JNUCC 0626]|uniref:hypothetical protein n=1 Tax=Lentzea sp. JNUCC 0626 TaxID=3367513 RepID=UPI003749F25F
MHFPGDSTWQVSSGGADTFVLYVRDALGVSTPTADAIPPLYPPVDRLHDVYVPETFGSGWDRWWNESLITGGGGRPPIGVPEHLHAAHRQWRPDFTSPEQSRLRDNARADMSEVLREIVEQLTTELGHPPVFNLKLVEIPVQGQFWRRVNTTTALVSDELKASRNLIAPLETVLRELAR